VRGKTKTELLAENAALRADKKRLERKIEILTQNVRGFLYDLDRAEREQKIERAAHKGSIDRHIDYRNQTWNAVANDRSERARHAANKRHCIPMPTVDALKNDFHERLEKGGQDAKPTTIYKDMAKVYIGRKECWRRIKNKVEK